VVGYKKEGEGVRSKGRAGMVVGDERGRVKELTTIHRDDWSIYRCLVTSGVVL
jgi:hypothetical protein